MTAQGWQPGDFLGAKDANQSEHYTAGSASHIRVMIKDDNLGLGAKIGSGVGHGECTGLDAFKDLLGRLNGKDEDEIEKEKKSREDLKVAIYSERKWGTTRFVKGGFLIGDKIQPLIEAEAERVRLLAENPSDTTEETSSKPSSPPTSDEEASQADKPKKSKKRKLEEQDEISEVVAVKVKKSKKKNKKLETRSTEADTAESTEQDVKESKKSKKESRIKVDGETAEEERKRRKKEKKARKEAERLQKENSRKRKSEQSDIVESSDSSTQSTTKESTSLTSAPSSGYSTPMMMQGRHAVRARNIAQKRLASMDVASLNQVCLLQPILNTRGVSINAF